MINFDNAATTKMSKQVIDAIVESSEFFYNPSALYSASIVTQNIISEARNNIMKLINAKPNSTVIFTGSASESNNAVLNNCIVRKDKKYIFSAGEHSSIYVTAMHYKELGYNIVFIPLNKSGSVNIELLKQELDDTVAFVSIIYVSNETGVINDIQEISNIVKSYNPNILLHTDAVQALGKVKINVKQLNVDFLTISAHKINGPKGIGALYISNPNKFKPFILGGGQEFNLRAGTENIQAIKAFDVAIKNLKYLDFSQHKKAIIENLDGDYILVSDENCVNNIISVCFKGVRGETIAHVLENDGYLIGTGSACNSKAKTNRVLINIVPRDYLDGAVRLSFGDDIAVEDCKKVAICLTNAVKNYRERINK